MQSEDRTKRVDALFRRHSVVIEVVMICMMDYVRWNGREVFAAVIRNRLQKSFGALRDGISFAQFAVENFEVVDSVCRAMSIACDASFSHIPKGVRRPVFGFLSVSESYAEELHDFLCKCSDEILHSVEVVEDRFDAFVKGIEEKESRFVLATRHRIAHFDNLLNRLFRCKTVSALVSDSEEADWARALICRLRMPNYIEKFALEDDVLEDGGRACWHDVAVRPDEYVLVKIRMPYVRQDGVCYYVQGDNRGYDIFDLANFIFMHEQVPFILDDISPLRSNDGFIDLCFPIRKKEAELNVDPFPERRFDLSFSEGLKTSDGRTSFAEQVFAGVDFRSEFEWAYSCDPKELCFALEYIASASNGMEALYPLMSLAESYRNVGEDGLVMLIVAHALFSRNVKGGSKKVRLLRERFGELLSDTDIPGFSYEEEHCPIVSSYRDSVLSWRSEETHDAFDVGKVFVNVSGRVWFVGDEKLAWENGSWPEKTINK